MSDLWERWRRRGATALCLGALTVGTLILLAGCGGGGSSSTTSTVAVDQPADGADEAPSAEGGSVDGGKQNSAATKQQSAATPAHKAHRAQKRPAQAGESETTQPSSNSGRPAPSHSGKATTSKEPGAANQGGADKPSTGALGGASPVQVAKLRKHCPKGVDSKTCAALVEAYVAAQGAETQGVDSPEQCTASRSQAECETVLKAQAEAAEGKSVNVKECLAQMTPACEAALRPLFESQQAARGGGG